MLLNTEGCVVLINDSVLGRRRTLAKLIEEGALDARVLQNLLPHGCALTDEDLFWDYKETLPLLATSPTKDEKDEYAYKMGETVKDVVSFYNMYGGYLIIGVRDGDKTLCGFDREFDVNDLCKKIQGATRVTIDVKFRLLPNEEGQGGETVGVLFIPRRPPNCDPVQFLKDAPLSKHQKRGYQANDIYMRSREECRKAATAADFALLFNREKLGVASVSESAEYIENNLPAKDPSLLTFVGRDEQLDQLWRWFVDRYTAVKLLSGPGGVGKTSIAWTFCDVVSRNPPAGLEKVVWLTAKKKSYAALLGRYVEISHTHFSDLSSLLQALLGELGVPENQVPVDPSREELIEECIEAVKAWPCLLVVDDIDSLPNEEQFDVFRTISTIFDRVIAAGASRARALLTARLNLGAAPGQLLQISGLPLKDFTEYAVGAAHAINVPLPTGAARKTEMGNLHKASNGSPLFAASILRLVSLGEPLSKAIRQYKGAEGEEVRRFAFQRELDSLTDNQLRLLFAAVHLRDCSIDELVDATLSNRSVVRDDIGTLRNYHLMSMREESDGFARENPRVSIPSELFSMADLIRKKIADPNRIEKACARLNRSTDAGNSEASRLFQRVVRYWAEDDFPLALEAAEYASRQIPSNPDVWCLLGRAYLKGTAPDARKADAALRKADELGSQRPELRQLRIETKQKLGDWIGIIHLLENREGEDGIDLGANETLALARAKQALGDDQARVGNWANAESLYQEGAEAIQEAFATHRAHGLVEPLKALKFELAAAFINAVSNQVSRDDDKLAIWEAASKVWKLEVKHRGIMTLGLEAASDWSSAVLRRENTEETTLRRLNGLTRAVSDLSKKIDADNAGWRVVVDTARRVEERLEAASSRYQLRLDQSQSTRRGPQRLE